MQFQFAAEMNEDVFVTGRILMNGSTVQVDHKARKLDMLSVDTDKVKSWLDVAVYFGDEFC